MHHSSDMIKTHPRKSEVDINLIEESDHAKRSCLRNAG